MSGYNHTKADDQAIATIRTLAVDTVGKANSGHPGRTVLLRPDSLSFKSFFAGQVRRWAWRQ